MDGTGIEAIAQLARNAAGKTVTIDDVVYSTTELHDMRKADPEPKALAVHTLTGLVGAIDPHLNDEDNLIVHVVSHAEVRVVARALQGGFKQRPLYAVAAFEALFGGAFGFGRFVGAEDAVIGLQSLFEDTDDRAKVLALVGNLREEAVRTTSDNGITQTVTARSGVQMSAEKDVPSLVRLRPFRTFREVEQPASDFILRLRGGGKEAGGQPTVGLFEADGGAWKADAIASVVAYLKAQLKGIPVIG